jgi:hypothetical protein
VASLLGLHCVQSKERKFPFHVYSAPADMPWPYVTASELSLILPQF